MHLLELHSNTAGRRICMSVSDLRDLIRSLAGRTSQCYEKIDLFDLARDLLRSRRCEICLDPLLSDPCEVVVKATCCPVVFHQNCWSEWILKAVQQGGGYPHKCPSCKSIIEDTFVTKKILTPADPKYLRYISAVESLKNLQSCPSQISNSLSQEEATRFIQAGFRKCPKCGAWIEKGPSLEAFGIPVAEGCDKMTCRCGCKFCFKCGSIDARCQCTGSEHGFFDHREVLADYPRSHIEKNFMSHLL